MDEAENVYQFFKFETIICSPESFSRVFWFLNVQWAVDVFMSMFLLFKTQLLQTSDTVYLLSRTTNGFANTFKFFFQRISLIEKHDFL